MKIPFSPVQSKLSWESDACIYITLSCGLLDFTGESRYPRQYDLPVLLCFLSIALDPRNMEYN